MEALERTSWIFFSERPQYAEYVLGSLLCNASARRSVRQRTSEYWPDIHRRPAPPPPPRRTHFVEKIFHIPSFNDFRWRDQLSNNHAEAICELSNETSSEIPNPFLLSRHPKGSIETAFFFEIQYVCFWIFRVHDVSRMQCFISIHCSHTQN